MHSAEDFFNLLFPDNTVSTVFTNKLNGVNELYQIKDRPSEVQRFCINELHPTKDLNPILWWHREDLPRRANDNVTCFRNMLIEVDSIPQEEQIKWVIKHRLPISTATSSGGKSVHFIISLEEPLKSYEEYNDLVQKLHLAVMNAGLKIDTSTKPPCQLSRVPNVQRIDYDEELEEYKYKDRQELLYVGNRINIKTLENWINYHLPKYNKKKKIKVNVGDRQITNTTKRLLDSFEYYGDSRHAALRAAGVQLRHAGFSIDEIEAMLTPVADTLLPANRKKELSSLLRWIDKRIHPEEG